MQAAAMAEHAAQQPHVHFFGELFEFNLGNGQRGQRTIEWNIQAAKRIAQARNWRPLWLWQISQCFQANPSAAENILPGKLGACDTDVPIIVVPTPDPTCVGQIVVIDGWHRMARAVLYGLPYLRAVELTASEEAAIRLTDTIYL